MAEYISTGTATGAAIGTGVNPGMGTIIGAAIGAGAGIIGTLVSNHFQNSANAKNLKFAKQQFEYQKYLNQNQISIQAADAQRAGINPMAMNNTNLSSTSMSAGQEAPDTSSIAAGGQIMASAIESGLNASTQKYIANKQAETAVKVAEIHDSGETERNNARIKAQEVIASRNARLTEQQNKLKEIEINNDKGYQDALVSIDRAKQEFSNYYNDEELKIKKQELERLEEELKVAKKNANTFRMRAIWRSINETISTGFGLIKSFVGLGGSSNSFGSQFE